MNKRKLNTVSVYSQIMNAVRVSDKGANVTGLVFKICSKY